MRYFNACILFGLLLLVLVASVACNVTRTITTQATSYQHGDTTTTITTKTVESYDATKRF